MVQFSRICFRKFGNFVDNLRLYVRGGTGGMGMPRLGGQGGNGGDVWVVATKNVTLKRIKDKYPLKRFAAGAGVNSSIRALKGEKGKDQEIFAPVGITVTTEDGRILGDLNAEGDRVMVAKGGPGGGLYSAFEPSKGQAKHIRLDLKLIADLGLVGFPNAGKSSLLTAMSNATPQIASYAFTTLKPEIGKLMYKDHKQISVADLPGLIEGAHINKGMGHKFLKHVERTKQLLFVVDVCGFQLASKTQFRSAFEAVQLLTKELELYKEELVSKPALLVVNKMDLPEAEDKLQELKEQLKNPDEFSDLLPDNMIPKKHMTFRQVVPISATTGFGIELLKSCIRESLDDDATLSTKAIHRERLQALRHPSRL
ncbi:putative GTP-binding protein 10 [Scophthalmus maximus]|uniref:GTP-binding protein 10 n=1 Tax=Scophthalmus maximus TaxID=52904 RepID=A0A2U9AY34_SCOMX|nr:GTP-binding protein 10 [Scophthalmus maximus]AWO96603.1 putative GTP-binding protein 10 [Scophthalmus maximus]